MLNEKKLITVFTPSYNRAHTLQRTYDSLCSQTSKNFIWLVVDDGSVDETKSIIDNWIRTEDRFEIRYVWKKNGGMHTAHNLAYELIDTELNVCVDSDDGMPSTAIQDIEEFWLKYGSAHVAGIIALDSDMKGNVLGSELPKDIVTATTDQLYEEYGATGDKKYIYRTDVIRSVAPYPEYEGEKLVPLGYKYSLVADRYPMLLMNKIVCTVEYQSDGSSNTIYRQYLQSPRGFAAGKLIRMTRTRKTTVRIKCIIHYIAECRIAKDKEWLRNSPFKIQTVLLYPFGIILQGMIYYWNRKRGKGE